MHSRLMLMTVTIVFAMCLSSAGTVMAQAGKEITNSIGMKLVLIPKGTFQMGSPESERVRHKDEVQHEVTLTQDYYLGAYEVTQAQYSKVMGKNLSEFQGKRATERHPKTGLVVNAVDTSKRPVELVSWDDAVEFCKRLSELPEEKKAGRVYRLPTEAEWEYACRAGSNTSYSFGDERDSLDAYAWFFENGENKTHPVGEKKPNAWGLYDMHGNVWEWCSDWYGEYATGAVSDPTGPTEGSTRVLRGGGWNDGATHCRSALRDGNAPSTRYRIIGFRIALSSPESTK